jgi:hypothetical protein
MCCGWPVENAGDSDAGGTSCQPTFAVKKFGVHLLQNDCCLNSDIESHAKTRRVKEKKNMLLQKFSRDFTNSVNSSLKKFLKTTLRLCGFA